MRETAGRIIRFSKFLNRMRLQRTEENRVQSGTRFGRVGVVDVRVSNQERDERPDKKENQ